MRSRNLRFLHWLWLLPLTPFVGCWSFLYLGGGDEDLGNGAIASAIVSVFLAMPFAFGFTRGVSGLCRRPLNWYWLVPLYIAFVIVFAIIIVGMSFGLLYPVMQLGSMP